MSPLDVVDLEIELLRAARDQARLQADLETLRLACLRALAALGREPVGLAVQEARGALWAGLDELARRRVARRMS